MKFIRKIFWFLIKLKPRYLLSLDSQFYNLSEKATYYRFKVFAEHTFPRFTFDDIMKNKNILHDIHPLDLMKITIDNHETLKKRSMLEVSEILRNNKYKLSANDQDQILSGDEICDNILLIGKINCMDLYKIAYNTGFNHGRQLAREINKKASVMNQGTTSNIITLQISERDKA